MSADRTIRIPPRGRRAAILRATVGDFQTMSDIDRAVRAAVPLPVIDPVLNRLKTVSAVRDLRRAGLLARTPYGWRATADGGALLAKSDEVRP